MFTKIPRYHCFQGLLRSLFPSRPAAFKTLIIVHRPGPAYRVLGFYSLKSEHFCVFLQVSLYGVLTFLSQIHFFFIAAQIRVRNSHVHLELLQFGLSSNYSQVITPTDNTSILHFRKSRHFLESRIYSSFYSFGQDVSSRNCCICNVVPASFLNCFCSLAGLLSSTCEFPGMFMSYSRKSQTIVRLLPPKLARTVTSRDRQ